MGEFIVSSCLDVQNPAYGIIVSAKLKPHMQFKIQLTLLQLGDWRFLAL